MYLQHVLQALSYKIKQNQECQQKQESENRPTNPRSGGDAGPRSEAVNSAIRELCQSKSRKGRIEQGTKNETLWNPKIDGNLT